MTLGPALHEFGWSTDDWPRLGAGVVAGHLLECGAQVTGGMDSDWNENVDLGTIGYPIAELRDDGTSIISKPKGSGGEVSIGIVSEQFVYEIGDPKRYLTPDVTADFSNVRLTRLADDQVLVEGASGGPPPATLKVSMVYDAGFTASGMIVVAGPRAGDKARAAAEAIRERMKSAGYELEQFEYECLGSGATLPGMDLWRQASSEIVLRVAARDRRRDAIERLTRELAPLVTSGPPAVTGYTGSRARSRHLLAYWPTTISRDKVKTSVAVRSAQEWLA